MEARHDVRIELTYHDGLQLKVSTPEPASAELDEALERYRSLPLLPALEGLPVLLDTLESAGISAWLSPDAEALRQAGDGFADQDEAMGEWVAGTRAPALEALRLHLKPYQLQAGAFLAFRKRALLADPRALEPVASAVLACEIVRSAGGDRVVIVSPEGRHAHWQTEIARLTGQEVAQLSGSRARRREILGERPSWLLVTPDELPKERSELESYGAPVIILDELPRYWGLTSRQLEAVRKLDPEYLFALSPIDPVKQPEALYGLTSLLAPVVAGGRQDWEMRYVDRSVKGQIGVLHERELRARLVSVMLRRTLQEAGLPEGLVAREVRRIPLGRTQRGVYDKNLKWLLTLIGKRGLPLSEQRRAEELLATMREVCDSMALRHEKQTESSKLEELRLILEEEVILGGRKVVLFSRWEATTAQISELLKQLKLTAVRHYRKLPIKRREGLLERFQQDESVRILLTTDTAWSHPGIGADLLIHFDVPWEPAVVTWRRAHVTGSPLEEITLVAADTLEEELWALPKPASYEGLEIEEEEAGVSGVHLFGRHASNLIRLKQILGLEPLPMVEEEAEENPAMAEVVAAAIEAHQAAEVVEAAPEAAPEVAPTPEAAAEVVPEAAPEAAPVEEVASPVEVAPEEAAPEAAPVVEVAPEEVRAQAPELEPEPPRPTPEPVPEGKSHAEEVLQTLEVPLKAVNRLLAAIPVVGQPLSSINGVLWEAITGRFRRR